MKWWQSKRCAYCERALQDPQSRSRTAATRDHRHPQSKGGTQKVVCCVQCNLLKSDMSLVEWTAFMQLHPRWWDMPQFRNGGVTFDVRSIIAKTVREAGVKINSSDLLRHAAVAHGFEKRSKRKGSA